VWYNATVVGDDDFWRNLDELVASCNLKVDRPKGTLHPRYPSFSYPLDYGYLEDTRSGDACGIDVWVGSLPEGRVTAVVCTVDLQERDAEVKVLVGCTPQEAQIVLAVHNVGAQASVLLERPVGGGIVGAG
jgi:inorganic pyrophosphatase